jgi:uncharacterized membrane protein
VGWSLGPVQLLCLTLAAALTAVTYRLVASAIAQRKNRRARGYFAFGFACGFLASTIVRGRLRRLQALTARCIHIRPQLAGSLWARHLAGHLQLLRYNTFDRIGGR